MTSTLWNNFMYFVQRSHNKNHSQCHFTAGASSSTNLSLVMVHDGYVKNLPCLSYFEGDFLEFWGEILWSDFKWVFSFFIACKIPSFSS